MVEAGLQMNNPRHYRNLRRADTDIEVYGLAKTYDSLLSLYLPNIKRRVVDRLSQTSRESRVNNYVLCSNARLRLRFAMYDLDCLLAELALAVGYCFDLFLERLAETVDAVIFFASQAKTCFL